MKRLDLVRSRIAEIKLKGCPRVGVANSANDNTLIWMIGSVLLVLVVGLVARHGTNVLDKSAVFDEDKIRVPIDSLVADGWSVSRAIDFEETKGPSMIWTYAVWGSLLGGDLNSLRLLSVLFFTLGVVPLLLICQRCGMRGPQLPLAAGLYVLLPYNAALAQLLMSESSFVFGSLCLMYLFMWGFGTTPDTQRRVYRLAVPQKDAALPKVTPRPNRGSLIQPLIGRPGPFHSDIRDKGQRPIWRWLCGPAQDG